MKDSTASRAAHDFSNLVREIRKKHTGKGPDQIVTRFVGPWAISEMKGNMTNLERFMGQTLEGKQMIHQTRTAFIKNIYEDRELCASLEQVVNAKFLTLYNDFNVDLDTAMTIFVFDRPLGLDSVK